MIVYGDESCTIPRPPVGSGLNKTAVVDLVFKAPGEMVRNKKVSLASLSMRLRQASESMGAEFLAYDFEKWKFKVRNFEKFNTADAMYGGARV